MPVGPSAGGPAGTSLRSTGGSGFTGGIAFGATGGQASTLSPAGPTGLAREATRARSAPLRWISRRGGRHRALKVRYRLHRRGAVAVTVLQLSPACRLAGTYRISGHRGVNVFRFHGRLHGRKLPPGTYLVVAHSLRTGHRLFGVRLVIVRSANPNPSVVAATGRTNVCAQISFAQVSGLFFAALPTSRNGSGTAGGTVSGSPAARASRADAAAASGQSVDVPTAKPAPPATRSGALGAIKTIDSSGSTNWLRTILLSLVGLALTGGAAFTLRDLRT